MIEPATRIWILVATALVLLMTPGVAFFYSGLVKRRNVINTMQMCIICFAFIPLLWFVCGYSVAFSAHNAFFGGFDFSFLKNISWASGDALSKEDSFGFFVFQMAFAILTPALISGAVVGRMRFKAFVIFIVLWSLLIYCPLAHMVWGPDGFISSTLGAVDFAGGMVVHISAGVSALVAALILGRRDIHTEDCKTPHNIPHVMLGAALLWFGWFGFNAGSSLAADQFADIAFINTILGASIKA